ncbi:hypothetical protein [Cupriavidus basilensis]
MRLGLGLSVVCRRRAGQFDGDDLRLGTLSLDFLVLNEPTAQLDFVANVYRAWVDDPSWPYGATGVFKSKG